MKPAKTTETKRLSTSSSIKEIPKPSFGLRSRLRQQGGCKMYGSGVPGRGPPRGQPNMNNMVPMNPNQVNINPGQSKDWEQFFQSQQQMQQVPVVDRANRLIMGLQQQQFPGQQQMQPRPIMHQNMPQQGVNNFPPHTADQFGNPHQYAQQNIPMGGRQMQPQYGNQQAQQFQGQPYGNQMVPQGGNIQFQQGVPPQQQQQQQQRQTQQMNQYGPQQTQQSQQQMNRSGQQMQYIPNQHMQHMQQQPQQFNAMQQSYPHQGGGGGGNVYEPAGLNGMTNNPGVLHNSASHSSSRWSNSAPLEQNLVQQSQGIGYNHHNMNINPNMNYPHAQLPLQKQQQMSHHMQQHANNSRGNHMNNMNNQSMKGLAGGVTNPISAQIIQANNKLMNSKFSVKPNNAPTNNIGKYGNFSESRERSRSRSPQRFNARGNNNIAIKKHDNKKKRSHSRSRSPGRKSSPLGPSKNTSGPLDYSKLTAGNLANTYHVPSINKNCMVLDTIGIYSRFNKLYVPNDFLKIDIDWLSIFHALRTDVVAKIHKSPTIMFENAAAAPLDIESSSLPSDIPQFSYSYPANYGNGYHSEYDISEAALNKPIKFNSRVIITTGFQGNENDTITVDHTFSRNLRVLCGRRKGSVMLLGGSWCKELDGGDPYIDRSCLLSTARRTVLSQSLLDIFECCSIVKLGEINYHRPKEEIKGKTFPEQREITAIYLCSIRTNIDNVISSEINESSETTPELFNSYWRLFCQRLEGKTILPTINSNPFALEGCEETSNSNLFELLLESQKAVDSIVGSESNINSGDISNNTANFSKEGSQLREDSSKLPDIVESETDIVIGTTPCIEPEIFNVVKDASSDSVAVDTTCVHNNANDSVSTTVSAAAVVAKQKPTKPCILICPQPLAKDVYTDAQKKQECLNLRILPLSSLLSYTLDDSSERIFEASVAAEMLQNLVAVQFSNIVTEFILAEHQNLSSLSDARVKGAVQKLREINERVKSVGLSSTKIAKKTDNFVEDGEEEETSSNSAAKRQKLTENSVLPDEPLVDSAAIITAAITDTSTENSSSQIIVVGEEKHDDSVAPIISELEARNWRRTFFSACRYFDDEQRKYIYVDHLELILHSSTHNISRSDISDACYKVCKENKFKYEAFI